MIRRLFDRLLLRPEDLQPLRSDFEVIGAFNPGVVSVGDEVILLVRLAERPAERRDGMTGLPRLDESGEIVVDWVPNDALEWLDPRVVRWKDDPETRTLRPPHARPGTVRLTFVSHLRVVRSSDGRSIDSVDGAKFLPESGCEEFGVEDPRITKIKDRYYFTYVAVSRHGAATALASTADFQSFERHGIIFCPENKDVVLFPEKFDSRFAALHRPVGATRFTTPEMWLATSSDLVHWGRHRPMDVNAAAWNADRVGAGAPPIRTPDGWLEIYHGSRPSDTPGRVGTYSAGAMLLDTNDPARVRRRSTEPVLVPQTDYERNGFVPNVIFPTGILETDDTLLIYSGVADTSTAVVELSRNELVDALQ